MTKIFADQALDNAARGNRTPLTLGGYFPFKGSGEEDVRTSYYEDDYFSQNINCLLHSASLGLTNEASNKFIDILLALLPAGIAICAVPSPSVKYKMSGAYLFVHKLVARAAERGIEIKNVSFYIKRTTKPSRAVYRMSQQELELTLTVNIPKEEQDYIKTHPILMLDILTTGEGTNLAACMQKLRTAGVQEVLGFSLAHTIPKPQKKKPLLHPAISAASSSSTSIVGANSLTEQAAQEILNALLLSQKFKKVADFVQENHALIRRFSANITEHQKFAVSSSERTTSSSTPRRTSSHPSTAETPQQSNSICTIRSRKDTAFNSQKSRSCSTLSIMQAFANAQATAAKSTPSSANPSSQVTEASQNSINTDSTLIDFSPSPMSIDAENIAAESSENLLNLDVGLPALASWSANNSEHELELLNEAEYQPSAWSVLIEPEDSASSSPVMPAHTPFNNKRTREQYDKENDHPHFAEIVEPRKKKPKVLSSAENHILSSARQATLFKFYSAKSSSSDFYALPLSPISINFDM